MASNVSPAFAYTVVYVKDVAKSVAFYAKAFGHNVRRLDESHRYKPKSNPANIMINGPKYVNGFGWWLNFLVDGVSLKVGRPQ